VKIKLKFIILIVDTTKPKLLYTSRIRKHQLAKSTLLILAHACRHHHHLIFSTTAASPIEGVDHSRLSPDSKIDRRGSGGVEPLRDDGSQPICQ
jgi:hypothetical protein